MKDELETILRRIAEHPAVYGLLAAIARWLLSDRKGGWWAFFGSLTSSCLVAWAASLWLADEPFSASRRAFFIVLLAFAARDILALLVLVGERARANPWEVLQRVIAALNGGPKP
jgi:hypothetical protein